jgi:uncharacterized membrane protein
MAIAEFLQRPAVQFALWMLVLVVVVTAAVWGLRKFRGYIVQDQTPPGDTLLNYRELHEQGVLSDAEYRRIKSRLHTDVRREAPDAERGG